MLENYARLTENKFEELFPYNGNYEIAKAVRYAFQAGGKRIRPALLLEFCRVYGGGTGDESTLAAAVSIECIHTFSLIHDDLPSMDNDDLRRGKPSCHKAFSEPVALLAGDALIMKSFGFIGNERIVKLFSDAAYNMCLGQELDLRYENAKPDESQLLYMYRFKTGNLLSAACEAGCILAGADDDSVSNAAEYGINLGMAFQLIDDILDLTSSEEELGKPIGSDREQGKNTYAILFGIDAARARADEYTGKALKNLEKVPNNEFLIELTNKLLKRIK